MASSLHLMLPLNIITVVITILLCSLTHKQVAAEDLTDGFTSLPLNTLNFQIQSPYDIPVDNRYSYTDEVHKMWVYNTDKPFSPTSHTHARTEIRIRGYDYSSGVWQFEGYFYVVAGTSHVCVMQVFGSSPPHATTSMLRVYNGALTYYRAPVLIPDVYDQWFRLNLIHDVDASKIHVYINGVLTYDAADRGGVSHYFKCGVYSQNDSSYYMESRWKDIKVLKKD